MFCSHCGQRLVGNSPCFCSECGSPLVDGAASAPAQIAVPEDIICRVGPCTSRAVRDSDYCSRHTNMTIVRKGEPKTKRPVSKSYPGANPKLVCPHCQTVGSVKTSTAYRKYGIDGEKAGAAVITGGLSVFMTGLNGSRKVTAAKCMECKVKWDI